MSYVLNMILRTVRRQSSAAAQSNLPNSILTEVQLAVEEDTKLDLHLVPSLYMWQGIAVCVLNIASGSVTT